MRLFRFVVFALFILPFCSQAQMQATQSDNALYIKLTNALNVVVMPIAWAPSVEITVDVKTGSIYEGDSVNGMAHLVQSIIARKLNAYLQSGNHSISSANTVFSSSSTSERTIFKLITSNSNVQACLVLIHDSIFRAKIDQPEVDTAVNLILDEIENNKHNNTRVFESKMNRLLYTQDHARLEIYGMSEQLKALALKSVVGFFKKYYMPNNALMTVTGPVIATTIEEQLGTVLTYLPNGDFNPETISKINGLRPNAYTTQFVVEDTISTPEFQICWQFPGMLTNKNASYPAYLITTMLNDRNNFIQVKAAKLGCKKFVAQYDANNFNGVFRITLQPSKKNFFNTLQLVVDEMDRLNETLVNDVMMSAAKLQFKKDYLTLKKTKEYPASVIKAWAFDNESYFPELLDSVSAVGVRTLRNFAVDYFTQSPHVTGLRINRSDRQELKIDSLFPEVDQSVKKYEFKYRPNITHLEGEENLTMQQNLLQWLLINNDVSVQVNGFSDEHEYNRAYDDSVLRFIDSIPTFQKSIPDIVKKKYLKPATMRAMKIVKYLYDHGIAPDRLSGTSMMYKSANKQEEADNRKCTLTLNIYLKSPSVFEYHYGKKKE